MSLTAFLARKTSVYLGWRVAEVSLAGKLLKITAKNGTTVEIPLADIRRVVFYGTPPLQLAILRKFIKTGIPVDWLDALGRPVGRIFAQTTLYQPHLREQMLWREDGQKFALARALILAKVDNCHEVLRRRVNHRLQWRQARKNIAAAKDAATLRGHEGIAAREYFASWKDVLGEFCWQGRKAYPAPDPVNLLLSSGYSQLRNRLASALANAGLDARIGIFHETRGSHAALASDLMEPLRALVDTAVLTLIRKKEVSPADFRMRGETCACANATVFKKLLAIWEEMFETVHKFYVNPSNQQQILERTVNDLLDDMAIHFVSFIEGSAQMLIPRLAPCPVI